ncbi:MAG TPA: HPr family phosphocarrier protein [Candidatus Binatia bacterium]|jgi:phosphocarrier protein|nr:HPr family phosphocarrier protein [Candidatus Binatia bacterium]
MVPCAPTECSATLEIVNRLGLHARAAALLVQTASRFDAEIAIAKDGQTVNGRSIMGVMMLAAEQGSQIHVTATGRQAREALDAIRALVAARFQESE